MDKRNRFGSNLRFLGDQVINKIGNLLVDLCHIHRLYPIQVHTRNFLRSLSNTLPPGNCGRAHLAERFDPGDDATHDAADHATDRIPTAHP